MEGQHPDSRIIPWPEDGSTARFEDLVNPLREVVDHLYRLERLPVALVPYVGHEVGSLHVALGVLETLEPEMLAYDEEDQGRDSMRVVLGLAVRLGIEQGKKIEAEERQTRELIERLNIGSSVKEGLKQRGVEVTPEIDAAVTRAVLDSVSPSSTAGKIRDALVEEA